METIIKQTREVGTSAGVILPRRWLNKSVVVTLLVPSEETITKDVLNILIEQKLNKEVKGIYLYGSYARGDYEEDSDIDILVITSDTNKIIKQDNYEIICVSEDKFSNNLSKNLTYLSLLSENKAIINEELIEGYRNSKVKLQFTKLLSEISGILKINEQAIKDSVKLGENVSDGIVYSVVLRLRELYIIKCLISGKKYSKSAFVEVCGKESYLAYKRVKNEEKEVNDNPPESLARLIELSKRWIKEIKN